jgi:hypothetical protein
MRCDPTTGSVHIDLQGRRSHDPWSPTAEAQQRRGHAERIVKAAMPDVTVVQRDPGGGSLQTHDFDLVRADGVVEAMEVTEATSEHLRNAEAARADQVPFGALPAPGLKRTWHLITTPATPFKRLGNCVPLLDQVEQAGLDRFFASTDALRVPAVQDLAIRFGIEAGFGWAATTSPKLVPGLPSHLEEWVSDPNDPGRWAREAGELEAHKADNMAKLTDSGVAERHLFVWVDSANSVPWNDLDRGDLPNRPPALPPAVTTLWVAAIDSGGRRIAWRVRPPGPWEARGLPP